MMDGEGKKKIADILPNPISQYILDIEWKHRVDARTAIISTVNHDLI